VPGDRREQFDVYYAARDEDPAVALVLSFVLGSFGIDRFYLGHVILGPQADHLRRLLHLDHHRLVPDHGLDPQDQRRHRGRAAQDSRVTRHA
jgi:hypothetical protein